MFDGGTADAQGGATDEALGYVDEAAIQEQAVFFFFVWEGGVRTSARDAGVRRGPYYCCCCCCCLSAVVLGLELDRVVVVVFPLLFLALSLTVSLFLSLSLTLVLAASPPLPRPPPTAPYPPSPPYPPLPPSCFRRGVSVPDNPKDFAQRDDGVHPAATRVAGRGAPVHAHGGSSNQGKPLWSSFYIWKINT